MVGVDNPTKSDGDLLNPTLTDEDGYILVVYSRECLF